MNKKIKQGLAVAVAIPMLTTSALSQLRLSGYGEAGYIAGSAKGTNALGPTKTLGQEFVILAENTGKTSMGDYRVFLNIDTDEVRNGVDRVPGFGNPFGARGIELMPTKETMLYYTYEGVYGGEIARTTVPIVTERPVDLTGASGLAELIDVTSGSHAVGLEFRPTGHRLSLAYSPNLDLGPNATSDRTPADAAQVIANAGANNSAAGYSFGYRGTLGPVTIGLGYTSIDHKALATSQDVDSKTLGLIYTQAPVAIGIQRTNNDGTKSHTVTGSNKERTVDTLAGTFAATKQVSVGLMYSRMETTSANQINSGPKTKVYQGVVAYNLGPVVISLAHEKAENRADAGAAISTTNGLDNSLTKVKIRANF